MMVEVLVWGRLGWWCMNGDRERGEGKNIMV